MRPNHRTTMFSLESATGRLAVLAGFLGVIAPGTVACVHSSGPAPMASAPQPVRGAPLPQGWMWPPSAGLVATRSFLPGVVRPIDAARLRSARPSAGCRPMEVTPGFFVLPECGFLPQMKVANSMSTRSRFQGTIPAAVDLRAMGLDGPVKDQQQVGVCWSFAISTLMDNGIRRAAKGDVVAPLHVLSADTFSVLFQKGKSDRPYSLEPTWPYDPVKACKLNEAQSEVWCEDAYHVRHGSWRSDPALVGEVERANATGVYRITKMETLDDPANPEEYAQIVAKGQAIYAAFEIDGTEWNRARGGIIGEYPTGTRGRHAVTVVGYRVGRGRELLIHNSWGASWGEGGYAWLSEATVRAHGKDAFTIEVDAGTPGQLPIPGGIPGFNLPVQLPFPIPGLPQLQPGPTPGPGQGGCAVRDVVFGSCANACPSGSPPVAGICAPAGSAPTPGVPQCSSGQVLDWASQTCVAQCQSGLPPIAGRCF